METLLYLLCVFSDDTQACLMRKYLGATGLNRKRGGFTEPQIVEAVLSAAPAAQYQYKSFLSKCRPDRDETKCQ